MGENSPITREEFDFIKAAIADIKTTMTKILDREENRLDRITKIEKHEIKCQADIENRLKAGNEKFEAIDKTLNDPVNGVIARIKTIETDYQKKESGQNTIRNLDSLLGLLLKAAAVIGFLLLTGYWLYTTKNHISMDKKAVANTVISSRGTSNVGINQIKNTEINRERNETVFSFLARGICGETVQQRTFELGVLQFYSGYDRDSNL